MNDKYYKGTLIYHYSYNILDLMKMSTVYTIFGIRFFCGKMNRFYFLHWLIFFVPKRPIQLRSIVEDFGLNIYIIVYYTIYNFWRFWHYTYLYIGNKVIYEYTWACVLYYWNGHMYLQLVRFIVYAYNIIAIQVYLYKYYKMYLPRYNNM